MQDKGLYTFSIDDEFKTLIRPLSDNEYNQLEANILEDGCRDPISIWRGIIIDGHHRYRICHEHSIPFSYAVMAFDNRDEVKVWICRNQLGRRNLTEEARKYLIGVQYEAEKQIGFRSRQLPTPLYEQSQHPLELQEKLCRRTSVRIGQENNISHSTVEKYASYSKALDEIGKKEPEMLPKILSGRYKLSHENVVRLSRMEPQEIQTIAEQIEQVPQPYRFKPTRGTLQTPMPSETKHRTSGQSSVKDMPEFDPDAESTGLTLTIPSWISSIERVRTQTDLHIITAAARQNLINALLDLQNAIMKFLADMRNL